MSIEAIKWALNDAPDVPPPLVSTLIGLANHAGPDGRNAYPKLATLARYTRKAERSVQRDLDALKELGLVKDSTTPGVVEHLPGGQRPAVYDLVMDRRRDPKASEKTGVRRGGRKHSTPDVDVTSQADVTPDVDVIPTPDVHVRSEPVATPDVHVRSTPDVDVQTPLTSTSRARLRNEPSTEPTGRTNPPSLRSGGTPDDAETKIRKPSSRGTRLPADWQPDAELKRWTLDAGMSGEQARQTLEGFRDYWCDKTGKDATKITWSGTWKRWVRKELENKPRGPARFTPRRESANDVLDRVEARLNGQHAYDPMTIDGELA